MIIQGARVPVCLLGTAPSVNGEDLAHVDIKMEGDRIGAVAPAAAPDVEGGIVVPAFVDMHTHLDKGHIWPRTANPDGTFRGALNAATADRTAHWSAADVARRMDFSLRCAHHHGTAAIRTHIDSTPPQDTISWPVFAEMRQAWEGRVALQGSSLVGVEEIPDDLNPVFDLVSDHGGIVGAVLYAVPVMGEKLAALMEAAEARGMDLDVHADETLDPASNCLKAVADEARRIGFSGQIVVGHCCSLMAMDEREALATLDAVAEQNIAIVSLPMCNLYLQDRDATARRTPRMRGGTLVHEMAARGIRVALASDNTRDPFYAYGDLDMAEVWREATRTLHLDHPVGDWPRAVSTTPADIMGLAPPTLTPGAPADLVVFKARDWTELFARPHTDRTVIRAGRVLDVPLPDYRELL